MLNVEEMTTIFLEVTLGRKPTLKGKEADALRKSIEKDKKAADKAGVVLEMPFEW